ncbi:GT4 family glycosyltransferase PelF [Anaerotalea alkaliphila]|uniref:DUF3492 domain-containing protein n=1 Tax=Anaerotalea alkaliphila TaxID=2662126 RepID=A0A7X5HXY5_9FIRM|nr:GT4 family glycosyltransferase PelF [Anaerotalea alkaliphila]NDL68709.1 DUF3492 domain-containing protein [Anaerotalea alkaliphila]
MKICLVAEGSYPYISGGVSSWVQQLINSMPEHQFVIIAINPDSTADTEIKYALPKNVLEVVDIYMDHLLLPTEHWNRRLPLSQEEVSLIGGLMKSEVEDWPGVFDVFSKLEEKGFNAEDIFSSKMFFHVIQDVYNKRYTHVSFMEMFWTMRSMYLMLFSLLLRKYPDADLYHSVSTGYAGILAAYASHRNGCGFVLTEHGIYTREREEDIIKADWVKGDFKSIWIEFFGCLSSAAYAGADRVVSLFNKNMEIQVDLGCDRNKIKVIPNGIRENDFEKVRRSIADRTDGREINVGAVVRVVPIKDIKTMLQAFAHVNKKLPGINFWIMGPTEEDEEYFEECIAFKDSLKLDNVVFTGHVNLREYLGRMDLLVLTSISEGQPLAILEGMACSLPFVSTNVGDCEALVRGCYDDFGPAGKVATVMDYEGIGEGIVALCRDFKLRRRLGENGYQRIKNLYSAEDFINGYKEIYLDLGERMANGRDRIRTQKSL